MAGRHKAAAITTEKEIEEIDTPEKRAGARRILHTLLLFWRVCPQKACKRARGCRGDVDACWRRWRPAIPDEVMMEVRAIISARAAGLPVAESVRAAREQVTELNNARACADEDQAERAAQAWPSPDLPAPAPKVRLM